jgi:UPF0755 protein
LKKILEFPAVRVVIALSLVVVLNIALISLRGSHSKPADYPCNQPGTAEVLIHVKSGESGSSVGRSLARAGVIESSEAYFRLAVGDVRATKVAAGTHRIQKGLCAKQALVQLLDSKRVVGLISITEGMWVNEVLPQMYNADFSRTDVQSAMSKLVKPQGFSHLEGLLFPAQYSFDTGTKALQALSAMVVRGELEMRKAGFFKTENDFTPQQLLTIASLVEAEGGTGDYSKVSQVIRNRLKKGMPLQFDSTVHYILQSRGKIFLSTKSTAIASPYNTYRRYGLPPGPINNPGAAAMRAAVSPEPGDWLYFITLAPGDTRFTADFSQFNKWKVEYRKNLRSGMFGGGR